ncbi:hypothetical protein Q7O_000888 [Pectobacterium carotovorum subsp. carotovorum PCCS1]|nr:hypothetical protein [Pectobacterium carotovorum subsp. carotovorum PCCS1]
MVYIKVSVIKKNIIVPILMFAEGQPGRQQFDHSYFVYIHHFL